jgi:uncharacterized membrane protein YGL010W
LGFSGTQFFPKIAGWLWLSLYLIGFIATGIVMKKSRVQHPTSRRINIAWLILVAYTLFWIFLLHLGGRESIAFCWTLCMCGFVISGLWAGRFFIWMGLIVTALTIAGFFLLPAWFYLWMAIASGGSLILSGLFIRKFWR